MKKQYSVPLIFLVIFFVFLSCSQNQTTKEASFITASNQSIEVANNKQNPIVTAVCLKKETYQSQYRTFNNELNSVRADLFDSINANSYTQNQIEDFIRYSQTSLINLRAGQNKKEPNRGLEIIDGAIEYIDDALLIRLVNYIHTKNYEAIMELLNENKISAQNSLGLATTLTAILVNNPDIDQQQLIDFIEAGLTPQFSDLVAMTRLQIKASMLEILVEYFHGDIRRVWYEDHHFTNLLMIASQENDPQLFKFWLSKGLPQSAKINDLTVVDVLPEPSSEEQLIKAQSLVELFIENQFQAYSGNPARTMFSWLPDDFIKENMSQLQALTKSPINGSDLPQQVLNGIQHVLVIEGKILDLQKLYTGCYSEPIQFSLLEGKQNESAHYIHKKELLQAYKRENMPTKQLLDMFTLQQTYLLDKNWEQYLNITNKLSNNHSGEWLEQKSRTVITDLILMGAPWTIIEEALSYDYHLTDMAIFYIVMAKRVELIPLLLPYGLDIDIKNQMNQTAIELVIDLGYPQDVVENFSLYLNE